MINNTRVNELQDKLLQAMDIINGKALQDMAFDKTIVCTIEDDSYKREGKYSVNDGARIFTAYSSDTQLKNKDSVYVTIPQGNFDNQKIIVGKKVEETDKPVVFTEPFDTLFDMTDNVVLNASKGALIANALNKYRENGQEDNNENNYEYVTLYNNSCNFYGFTRLGLKASFKSWIKSAVRGDYGLTIILTASNPGIASTQQVDQQEFYYVFSNKDLYGNPYDFETDYEQQIVIPLDEIKGTITNIKINFYQEANFFDKFNEPIPCSEYGYKLMDDHSNRYDRDEDGDYVLKADDTLLDPNIFVKDIYLCFGYDISTFTKDMVEIYTQQSNTYRHSEDANNDGKLQNKKEIKARWIHIGENGPVDMVARAQEEDVEKNYEVRWYRYKIGASAADPYCGAYWTRINGVNGFSYLFDPDIDLQQEKIKVIIIYNSSVPYRSNELLFENEEDLPPSAEAYHIENALNIIVDDGTNGNYMVYGQDNSIKDTAYAKEIRSLSAMFDGNSNGELESHECISEAERENIVWTFPANNTMIELLSEDRTEIVEGVGDTRELLGYTVVSHAPIYRISSYYSPNKLNNTVTCQYTLNGRVYKTEKELTFGPAGTMGTEQTLVIDFLGDMNAVNKAMDEKEVISFRMQLYNKQNVSEVIPSDTGVVWSWYYNSALEEKARNENKTIKFPILIEGETIKSIDETNETEEKEEYNNSVISFINSDFNINHLYILQGTVGNLTTYFPIPIQEGSYSYIQGPTQVIYQSNGEPAYNRDPYYLYTDREGPQEKVAWKIIHHIDEKYIQEQEKFIGQLSEKNKLQPLSIYTKDAPVYGVQAYTIMNIEKEQNSETVIETVEYPLWTQPILVLQNLWPNGVINDWDGKSLVLDEKNSLVLATAMAAGKKNDDNTFSGVMLGNWENKDTEGSISKQTGVYGFHHGAMSYAFKEDGTAFLGKDGKGRIYIDGNDATIYSETYSSKNHGIKIDLNEPYIVLSNSYNKENIANESTDIYPFQIGSNFKVQWDGTIDATNGEFSGKINANSGTIGQWVIESADNATYPGALRSDDKTIVLSTEGTGTILINEDDIIIRGSYYDEGEKQTMPTQMTLSNNSVIHGGIIEAGTLRSNGGDNIGRINLEGYLTIGNYGHLGYITSGIPGSQKQSGIGMDYTIGDKTYGEIKVTKVNSGLNFGNCYISISGTGIAMGNSNGTEIIDFSDFTAEQQKGIYARFA